MVKTRWLAALLVALAGFPVAARAADPDGSVVNEILGLLKERGIVDDAEYERLAAKNKAYEQKQETRLPKLSFYGDARLRYEGFRYDPQDGTAAPADRDRARYRIRLGAMAEINDHVSAGLRLASGEDDNRSANVSFGNRVDFAPDRIFLDQGWIQFRPFTKESMPLEGGTLSITAGKVANPFRWNVGPDYMLWDADITPSGVSLELGARPFSNLRWFANAGYFIIQENSATSDPHMTAAQVGAELTPIADLALGGRVSWYGFQSLNASFLARGVDSSTAAPPTPATKAGGNLPGGLTGDPTGGSANVGETSLYVTWKGIEDWPITAFADFSENFDAAATPGAGKNELAYGAGVELGDKARWVRLGAGWWHLEANAFPSQFVDSDLLDGFTNREGWTFYAVRQLFKSTDLKVELFGSGPIREGSAFATSVAGSDRLRFRTDIDVKF